MAEMNDREKLIALLKENTIPEYWAEMIADHLIASGVAVREKGEWIEDGYYGNPFVCSYCGHEGCYSGNYGDKDYYPTNFCPNCGADMRAEEQNRAREGENG
jgi:hypothetical protein